MSEQKWNRLFFDEWVAREGLDLVRGYKLDDVYTVELKPWARTGGKAVHIQLEGTGDLNAAYVCEIPAGKHLEPLRHVYEEMVYVLSGIGSTSVWSDESRKTSFEWQAGSLFALPLNVWHQHFNGSGSKPARFLAVTTAPIMMNLMRSEEFIFNNDAPFPERFNNEENYFDGQIRMETITGEQRPRKVAMSNLFPDINGIPEDQLNQGLRGVKTRGISFDLANGILGAHVLEFPGCTFSQVHRHGPGAHVLWLKGEGYSLMWPDGGEKIQADFHPGTMLVPPAFWWHQHAIVSGQPAQHLALRLGSARFKLSSLSDGVLDSIKVGGNQMEYDDFPAELMAEIKQRFTAECAKHGTQPLPDFAAAVPSAARN